MILHGDNVTADIVFIAYQYKHAMRLEKNVFSLQTETILSSEVPQSSKWTSNENYNERIFFLFPIRLKNQLKKGTEPDWRTYST